MTQNEIIKNGVSIIICCYNSAKRLPNTLQHLSLQAIPGDIPYELVIVNNASTDNTSDIARIEWNRHGSPYPMIIVEELEPGLSFAREKGINTANYDTLIFCDDDNWLSSNYGSVAHGIMHADISIGALGGRSEAVSSIDLPFWFSSYQANYAVGVLGLRSGDITSRGHIWGAGLVIRKSDYLTFRQCGFSLILTGRKQNKLSGGEDTELCKWFMLWSKKLWYDERLSFKHYIEPHRLNLNYIETLHRENENYYLLLKKYDIVINHSKTPKFKEIFTFSKHLIRYGINITFHRQQYDTPLLLELYNPFSFISFDAEIKKIKVLKAKIKQYNF